LNSALDAIEERFGAGAIQRGVSDTEGKASPTRGIKRGE
jgi:hypothetical protein